MRIIRLDYILWAAAGSISYNLVAGYFHIFSRGIPERTNEIALVAALAVWACLASDTTPVVQIIRPEEE